MPTKEHPEVAEPSSAEKEWAAAGFILGVAAGMVFAMLLIMLDRYRFG